MEQASELFLITTFVLFSQNLQTKWLSYELSAEVLLAEIFLGSTHLLLYRCRVGDKQLIIDDGNTATQKHQAHHSTNRHQHYTQ